MLGTLFLAAAQVTDVKAKNPILPEGKEILWASIAFIIVLSLLAWKAWPAVKAGLKARQDRIASDLSKAEEARVEAESSLEDYRRQLAEARNEAATIIEAARQDAEHVRQERIALIDGEIAQLRARAAEDIRLATERAMSDLVPGRRAVDRAVLCRGRRPAEPGPRHADPADRELHQRGRRHPPVTTELKWRPCSARVGDRKAVSGQSERRFGGVSRWRGGRVNSVRSRTTCSASLARSRAATTCAWRSPTRRCRQNAGSGSSRSCSARRRFADEHGAGSVRDVGAGRASEIGEIVDRFLEKAAAERQHEVAEVRPRPCSMTSRSTVCAEALTPLATGVEAEVVVDRRPVGAGGFVVTRIGDTVIDGSVRHRLEQLKGTI